jgi:Homeodomain-like domain
MDQIDSRNPSSEGGSGVLPNVTARDGDGDRLNKTVANPPVSLPNVTARDGGGDRLNGEQPAEQPAADDALDERRQAAMQLLLAGMSVARVAKEIGVHRQTLWRWRNEPGFAAELKRRGEEMWDENARRLQGMLGRAIDVMEHQLGDRYERIRFRAAQAILSLSSVRKFVPPARPPARPGKEQANAG